MANIRMYNISVIKKKMYKNIYRLESGLRTERERERESEDVRDILGES